MDDARDSKTKKLSKHVTSGWCTYSKFAYGDVPVPYTPSRGEVCTIKFVDYIENEVMRLYDTFPQKQMTELTEAQKR